MQTLHWCALLAQRDMISVVLSRGVVIGPKKLHGALSASLTRRCTRRVLLATFCLVLWEQEGANALGCEVRLWCASLTQCGVVS